MNNDFKKGFSIGAGVIVALLIPTGIYFLSSTIWKNNEKNREYTKWLNACIEANLNERDWSKGIEFDGKVVDNINVEAYFKSFCKKNDHVFWNAWKEKQTKK